jgi:hypothetical protein
MLAAVSLLAAVVAGAQPVHTGGTSSAEMLFQLIERIVKLPELEPVKLEPVLGMKAELAETVGDFRRDYRLVGEHPLVRSVECRWNHRERKGLVALEIDPLKSITRGELFPLLKAYRGPWIITPTLHTPPHVATTGFVFKTSLGEVRMIFPGFPPAESAPLRSVVIDQYPQIRE